METKYSDFKLVLTETDFSLKQECLPVHRIILLKSQYFKSLLTFNPDSVEATLQVRDIAIAKDVIAEMYGITVNPENLKNWNYVIEFYFLKDALLIPYDLLFEDFPPICEEEFDAFVEKMGMLNINKKLLADIIIKNLPEGRRDSEILTTIREAKPGLTIVQKFIYGANVNVIFQKETFVKGMDSKVSPYDFHIDSVSPIISDIYGKGHLIRDTEFSRPRFIYIRDPENAFMLNVKPFGSENYAHGYDWRYAFSSDGTKVAMYGKLGLHTYELQNTLSEFVSIKKYKGNSFYEVFYSEDNKLIRVHWVEDNLVIMDDKEKIMIIPFFRFDQIFSSKGVFVFGSSVDKEVKDGISHKNHSMTIVKTGETPKKMDNFKLVTVDLSLSYAIGIVENKNVNGWFDHLCVYDIQDEKITQRLEVKRNIKLTRIYDGGILYSYEDSDPMGVSTVIQWKLTLGTLDLVDTLHVKGSIKNIYYSINPDFC
jgi:hypothetical protein